MAPKVWRRETIGTRNIIHVRFYGQYVVRAVGSV